MIRALVLAAMLTLTVTGTTIATEARTTVQTAVPVVSYMSYLNHEVNFLNKFYNTVSAMSYAANNYNIPELVRTLRLARNQTTTEVNWLNAHRPKTCFAAQYNRYKSAMNYYRLAFTNLYTYWSRWPYASSNYRTRGISQMNTGSTRLDQATALLKKTHC